MGQWIWNDMDEIGDNRGKAKAQALLRALQPALPAVIGAAALTFLFAAVMPLSWVAGISWNLYLDRLSDLFVPPVGNGGRLALALGMAALAALVAGLVALLIATPDAAGLSALRDRFRRASNDADEGSDDWMVTRRRADLHPDDPPRPPIRAGRDLPAGGLGPIGGTAAREAETDLWPGSLDQDSPDELVLADLAPDEVADGEEPWLQPADLAAPAMPAPEDHSLGAMVARLEAGLARRWQHAADQPATLAIPMPEAAAPDPEPEIDFALEAALGTLQRMTRHSVG